MAAPNYDKTPGTYVYATIPGSLGLASYCATFTEGESLLRPDREPDLRVWNIGSAWRSDRGGCMSLDTLGTSPAGLKSLLQNY